MMPWLTFLYFLMVVNLFILFDGSDRDTGAGTASKLCDIFDSRRYGPVSGSIAPSSSRPPVCPPPSVALFSDRVRGKLGAGAMCW